MRAGRLWAAVLAAGGAAVAAALFWHLPAGAGAAAVAGRTADTAAQVATGLASGAAAAVKTALADAAAPVPGASAPAPGGKPAAAAGTQVAGSPVDEGPAGVWSAAALTRDQIKARIADAAISEADRVQLSEAFQQAGDATSVQAVLDRLKLLEAKK